MKDQIEKLLKESKVETSHDFTDQLMNKLDRKLERKMRLGLYLLMAFVLTFFGAIVFMWIQSGYQISAFGLSVAIPKTGPILTLSLLAFLVVMHVRNLVRQVDI